MRLCKIDKKFPQKISFYVLPLKRVCDPYRYHCRVEARRIQVSDAKSNFFLIPGTVTIKQSSERMLTRMTRKKYGAFKKYTDNSRSGQRASNDKTVFHMKIVEVLKIPVQISPATPRFFFFF